MSSFCSLGSSAALVSLDQATSPGAPAASGSAKTQERSQSFKPVTGGSDMQSGEMLLLEAYSVIWLLVFGMMVASLRRQRKLDVRIARLEQDLERARQNESSDGARKDDDRKDDDVDG